VGVPRLRIDAKTGGWTDGYARRATDAFESRHKQNHIAQWLLAMTT